MFYIEVLAVLFTLLSVYLTVKKNIHCWSTGIIALIFYAIIFLDARLYANLILQGIFFIQSVYGWIVWKQEEKERPIRMWNIFQSSVYATLSGLLLIIVYYTLANYTNGNFPFMDSTATVLSLVANWALAKKYLDNWVLWIVVDIIYIVMFIMSGLYLSAILYFILLILAVMGFKQWIKTYNEQTI